MKVKSILASLLFLGMTQAVFAEPTFEISITEHRFHPAEITIPANTRVKLVVNNNDAGVEEFHSDSLHREKIIGGNQSGIIKIGPLSPGEYSFMGEFHADTAQGKVIVK